MNKKSKIEIVSYSGKPVPVPKKQLALTVLGVVVLLSAFSIGTYFLLGVLENSGDHTDPAPELKAVIDQGWGLKVWEKEDFVLSAHGSTGSIDRYLWEVDEVVIYGKSITHRFNTARQYIIRLEVQDITGNTSRTWTKVHVNHRQENVQGSTSSSSTTYSRNFDVHGDDDGLNTLVSKIRVDLVYPVGSNPENHLNFTITDGSNNIVEEGIYILHTEGGENFINWTISGPQWLALYSPGMWTVTVEQEAPVIQPRSIDFTIDIYVMY